MPCGSVWVVAKSPRLPAAPGGRSPASARWRAAGSSAPPATCCGSAEGSPASLALGEGAQPSQVERCLVVPVCTQGPAALGPPGGSSFPASFNRDVGAWDGVRPVVEPETGGGLLGGAGPVGSSRQVWHMVSVRCPQLAFQGWG